MQTKQSEASSHGTDVAHTPGGTRRGWWVLAAGLLVGAVLGAAGASVAGSDSSDLDRLATNEALVDRWIAAVETRDPAEISSLYSEDALWIDEALGERFDGQGGARRGWTIFSLPDFEIRALETVAVGRDSAVTRWTFAGSRSPLSPFGPWEVTGLSLLEISDGQVVAETVYYDEQEMRREAPGR